MSSETGTPGSRTYGYSPRDQLTSQTSGSTVTSFAYDGANNPTSVGATTQTFDSAGQLKAGGTTSYSFDSEGERTATTPASGTATSYSYNQAGQLISTTGPGGTGSYTYNGDGLRATKTVSGATTTFVWDDESTPNLLSDGSNSYLYGPDALPIEQISATASYWFVHDQVGSTVLLLGSAGTQAGSYSYTAYGLGAHTGTATTPLQYAGQYTDAESGLVYMRARYYDPATAQFLTVDPLVNVTHTPYSYVDDSPLNSSDPSGDCPTSSEGYRPGNQNPAQLSPEEEAAIAAKLAGEPYDPKVFKRAMKKINQGEKYTGPRNQQKRQNNKKNNSKFVPIAEGVGVGIVVVGVVAVVAVSLPVDAVVAVGAGIGAVVSWAF